MNISTEIIKQYGNRASERFMRQKLHDSIVAACLSARTPEGQAESIAHSVCESVVDWLSKRPEVTAQDIRTVAAKHLKTHHPDASYLYEQNRITI